MKTMLLVTLLLTGCGYCLVPEHKIETRCKVQAIVADCGGKLISALITQIVPQLVGALVSEDWSAMVDRLVNSLEQQGVTDGMHVIACAMQHIDGSLTSGLASKQSFANQNTIVIHTHAQLWLKQYSKSH